MARNVHNLRIDTRGHILAVQIVEYGVDPPGSEKWWWYDLAGNLLSSGAGVTFGEIYGLRLDARGHILAVLKGKGGTYRWYDLDGTDLGVQATWLSMYHIRIDTRGHVAAVYMADSTWYNLNGDAIP